MEFVIKKICGSRILQYVLHSKNKFYYLNLEGTLESLCFQ